MRHFGNGLGSFGPQQVIPVGQAPRGLAVLDVDADGDTDVVTANAFSSNLSLLLNDGAGGFDTVQTLEGGPHSEWSLMSGDMNNDGILDLVTGSRASSTMEVLLGNGDGSFTVTPSQDAGGRSWQIALGDVNGDGRLDVASANSSSNTGSILLGNGDGTLQPPEVYPLRSLGATGGNSFPLATDLGDLDGDGDLDWVTSSFGNANANGDWLVFLNDGTGHFEFFTELDAPTAASCSLLHDFDNDGDLDLGLIDELANVLILSRNAGTAVPEPGAGILLVSMLFTLEMRRRRIVAG